MENVVKTLMVNDYREEMKKLSIKVIMEMQDLYDNSSDKVVDAIETLEKALMEEYNFGAKELMQYSLEN